MFIPTNNNGPPKIFERSLETIKESKNQILKELNNLKDVVIRQEIQRSIPPNFSLIRPSQSPIHKVWPSKIDIKLCIGSILNKTLNVTLNKAEPQEVDHPLNVGTFSASAFKHLESDGKASELVQRYGMEKIGDKLPYIELILNAKIKSNTISPDIAKKVQNDINNLKEMASYDKEMRGDNFNAQFVNKIVTSRLQMREGDNPISSQFPKSLETHPDDIQQGKMKDENGDEFDHLRGPNGLTETQFANFCDTHGGSYALLDKWMREQGGDSWSGDSQIFKCLLLEAMGEKADKYFWKVPFHGEGNSGAGRALHLKYALEDKDKRPTFKEYKALHNTSLAHQMAYTMEFLTHTKMPGVIDHENQTITVYRTESPAGLEANNVDIHDTENLQTMKRSVFESVSIIAPVFAAGTEGAIKTKQVVPLRNLAFGFQLRQLLTDKEREMGMLTKNTPFKICN